MSEQDQVREHRFDGIQEFDNRLPNWWLWTFFGACIFSVVYWAHYHVLETGAPTFETYSQEYEAYKKGAAKPVTNEELLALSKDEAVVAEGKAIFEGQGTCFSCHTKSAGGVTGLGVNLTDDHWKHGPKPIQMYNTIMNGVPGTSMTNLGETLLGAARTKKVVAYLETIKNTNVEGGLPPEGKPTAEWEKEGQ
jgi:cytochrome c oxidase cbb3-type subunit 3